MKFQYIKTRHFFQSKSTAGRMRNTQLLTPMTKGSLSKPMEIFLKEKLNAKALRSIGCSGGGCISEGHSYDTDQGEIFVKTNTNAKVKIYLHVHIILYT